MVYNVQIKPCLCLRINESWDSFNKLLWRPFHASAHTFIEDLYGLSLKKNDVKRLIPYGIWNISAGPATHP